MRKKYLTIPFILIYFLSFSQTNFNLEKVYRDYFDLPRESMFIHTNKTTYLTGENIWFKVYVYDKLNKKPSIETKNIYVGIFDSKGNQVSKKLYLDAIQLADENPPELILVILNFSYIICSILYNVFHVATSF